MGEKLHFEDGSASIMLTEMLSDGAGIKVAIFNDDGTPEKCCLLWGEEKAIGNNPKDFFRAVKRVTAFSAACFICSRVTVCTDVELYENGGFSRKGGIAAVRAKQTETEKSPAIHYKKRGRH